MFPNLRAEMARYNIKHQDLADGLGVTKHAIDNKMIGKVDFRRGEIFEIRNKFFPEMSLEYLFQVGPIEAIKKEA